mgnify:CR=1 FL=1
MFPTFPILFHTVCVNISPREKKIKPLTNKTVTQSDAQHVGIAFNFTLEKWLSPGADGTSSVSPGRLALLFSVGGSAP